MQDLNHRQYYYQFSGLRSSLPAELIEPLRRIPSFSSGLGPPVLHLITVFLECSGFRRAFTILSKGVRKAGIPSFWVHKGTVRDTEERDRLRSRLQTFVFPVSCCSCFLRLGLGFGV